jgi:lysophospholipase L1-like esterase
LRILRAKSIRVALTIAMFLALGEAALRARSYVLHGSAGVADDELYQPDPVLGKVLRPRARLRGTRGELTVNSLGFRGPEFPADKPPGTCRIVCMGDSVVFGRYAPSDDLVWTALLQERLTRRWGRPVQVINAGVPGYSVETNIKLLRLRILPLHPDLIIVCQVVNDLNNTSSRVFGPQSDRPKSAGSRRLTPEQWLDAFRDRNVLLHHIIRKNVTPLVTTVGGGPGRHDKVPPDFGREYERQLAALVDLARAGGPDVVLCTAWKAFGPAQPAEAQEANAASLLMVNPYLSLPGLYAAFDAMNQAVRTVARDRGVALIDLAELVPADPRLFRDAVHVSAEGEGVLADTLAARLPEKSMKKADHGVQ